MLIQGALNPSAKDFALNGTLDDLRNSETRDLAALRRHSTHQLLHSSVEHSRNCPGAQLVELGPWVAEAHKQRMRPNSPS